MKTIIRHGNKRRAICLECGCEFFYEDEDIRRGNQRDWYMVVDCPDCRHHIDLTGGKGKGEIRG